MPGFLRSADWKIGRYYGQVGPEVKARSDEQCRAPQRLCPNPPRPRQPSLETPFLNGSAYVAGVLDGLRLRCERCSPLVENAWDGGDEDMVPSGCLPCHRPTERLRRRVRIDPVDGWSCSKLLGHPYFRADRLHESFSKELKEMIDQDQSMVDEHLGSHETGILPDLSSATPGLGSAYSAVPLNGTAYLAGLLNGSSYCLYLLNGSSYCLYLLNGSSYFLYLLNGPFYFLYLLNGSS
ncbi:unnamed protein product [Gadus morhua 'NCC']